MSHLRSASVASQSQQGQVVEVKNEVSTWKIVKANGFYILAVITLLGLGIAALTVPGATKRRVAWGGALVGFSVLLAVFFFALNLPKKEKRKNVEANIQNNDAADAAPDSANGAGQERRTRVEEGAPDQLPDISDIPPVQPRRELGEAPRVRAPENLDELIEQYTSLPEGMENGNEAEDDLIERMIFSASTGGMTTIQAEAIATFILQKVAAGSMDQRAHQLGALYSKLSSEFIMNHVKGFLNLGFNPYSLFNICKEYMLQLKVDGLDVWSRKDLDAGQRTIFNFIQNFTDELRPRLYQRGLGADEQKVREFFEKLYTKPFFNEILSADAREQYFDAKFEYHIERITNSGKSEEVKIAELQAFAAQMLVEMADLPISKIMQIGNFLNKRMGPAFHKNLSFVFASIVDLKISQTKNDKEFLLTELDNSLKQFSILREPGRGSFYDNFVTALWSCPHLLEELKGGKMKSRISLKKTAHHIASLRQKLYQYRVQGKEYAEKVGYEASDSQKRFCQKIKVAKAKTAGQPSRSTSLSKLNEAVE